MTRPLDELAKSKWLSTDEAELYSSIPRRTLYRLRDALKVTTSRVGDGERPRYRFLRESLDKYLDARTIPALGERRLRAVR